MASATNHQLHILELPQSIQDRVFDLSFPMIPNLRLITHDNWTARELYRRRENGKPQASPFPGQKVNDFLVSKQFFLAAAKAWVGNQIFDEIGFVQEAKHIDRRTKRGGIFYCFVRKLRLKSRHLKCLQRFPSLEEETIDVDDDVFVELRPKRAWEVLLAARELESLPFFCTVLNQGSALRRVVLQPAPCIYALGENEERIWRANIEKLESIINKRLASNESRRNSTKLVYDSLDDQGRPMKKQASRDPGPLYEGSRVCHASTEAIQQEPPQPQTHPFEHFTPRKPVISAATWPRTFATLDKPKFSFSKGDRHDSVTGEKQLAYSKASKDSVPRNTASTPEAATSAPILLLTTPSGHSSTPSFIPSPPLKHSKARLPPQNGDFLAVPKSKRKTDDKWIKMQEQLDRMESELNKAIELGRKDLEAARRRREFEDGRLGSGVGEIPFYRNCEGMVDGEVKDEEPSRLLDLLSSGGMIAMLGFVYYAVNVV